MSNDVPPLARNLARAIESRGYRSARAFALEAGVNYDTLRSMLRGKSRHGRSDTIERIARFLQLDPATLRGDVAGLAEPAATPIGSAPLRDLDADDDAFAEVAEHAARLLTEEGLAADPRSVARLSRRLWRELNALPERLPFVDRLTLCLDEQRAALRQGGTASRGSPGGSTA